ncbi:MAG TPA: GNAT family N-acetyltransferase [Solirubrobacterales bacterium]|nr:GNAT family N-acetyltransferase [Solirubrobacterales bacterium]
MARLWTAANTDDLRGGRTTPYAPADFHSAAKAAQVLVAREGAALAGVVVFFVGGSRDGMVASAGEAELSRLAVAVSFRRLGIGRNLVERCLELARSQGSSALVLWSQPHQVEAHQLYSSLGFRRAPDRDLVAATGPRLVFSRRP